MHGWYLVGAGAAGVAGYWLAERLARRFGARPLPHRWAGALGGALLAVVCAVRFTGWAVLPAGLACLLLYALARVDASVGRLPDSLNGALAGIGLVWIGARGLGGADWGMLLAAHGLGAVVISLPLAGLRHLWPGSLGGGDVKLMAAGGLLLGWAGVLPGFVLAVLLAGARVLAGFLTGRLRPGDVLAFGPFLCAGLGGALLFRAPLVGWFFGGLV